MSRLFRVIESATGQEPDLEVIALNEPWANGLTYCDMEGFAVTEDGQLILMDECGQYVFAPLRRFLVKWNHADCKGLGVCSACGAVLTHEGAE